MKTFQVLILVLMCLSVAPSVEKRALNQFMHMIRCVKPEDRDVMDYNKYGCYCGKGGSGEPIDDLDRCCQVHDQCYDDTRHHSDCGVLDHPYIELYDYSCDSENKKITCTSDNNECEALLCECDKAAAECFARQRYNPDLKRVSSEECF